MSTSNQHPTKGVGASLMLFTPDPQAFYFVFHNYFYDDRVSEAAHLTFYKLFSCNSTDARYKKRATNTEFFPIQLVCNPINFHRLL